MILAPAAVTFCRRLSAPVVLLLAAAVAVAQMPDPSFKPTIESPAYTSTHPRVVIDQAHGNYNTADGLYGPLADLLRADGYEVAAGTRPFSAGIHANVLIIANATRGIGAKEIGAVASWVDGGGALLLIADHTPYGAAARALSRRFGVDMGNGFVFDFDPGHSASGEASLSRYSGQTDLLFDDQNELLGHHAINRGRNSREQVHRVIAFTGQSLSVPRGAAVLLRLGPNAIETQPRRAPEVPTPAEKLLGFSLYQKRGSPPDRAKLAEATKRFGVGGRAQALALRVGRGRVVIAGEAGMFSAQLFRRTLPNGKRVQFRLGMNVPGNDDRQFVLNVLHWLSGALE
jgi:hypothetical protein